MIFGGYCHLAFAASDSVANGAAVVAKLVLVLVRKHCLAFVVGAWQNVCASAWSFLFPKIDQLLVDMRLFVFQLFINNLDVSLQREVLVKHITYFHYFLRVAELLQRDHSLLLDLFVLGIQSLANLVQLLDLDLLFDELLGRRKHALLLFVEDVLANVAERGSHESRAELKMQRRPIPFDLATWVHAPQEVVRVHDVSAKALLAAREIALDTIDRFFDSLVELLGTDGAVCAGSPLVLFSSGHLW